MDSNDDSLLAESVDSQSDQETDESSESSSHEMPSNKILILSAESLSSAEGSKYVLPPGLELGSLNAVNKSGLNNISPTNAGKGNPVVIKAQPISGSQYILLPQSSAFPTAEEQNSLQIENVFYNYGEGNSERKKSGDARVRERNVTPVEKRTLYKICEKYPEIDVKDCNNEANRRKRKAWEDIHRKFIAACPDPESKDRSIKFLQGCWKRFKKEMRKAGRVAGAHSEEEGEEAVYSLVHSTPSVGGTESQHDLNSNCSNSENTAAASSENAVHLRQSSESLMNRQKTISSKTLNEKPCTGDLLVNVASDSRPISLDSGVGKSVACGGKTISFSSDSNCALRNGDSGVSRERTVKTGIAETAAESAMQANRSSQSHSEFKTRPMSTRSLRRRALELAVEIEKEKLAASRYRREAEQERLAAMKLQRSAQRYALMVEKERYETELLKREAARMSLEKLS